MEYGSEFHAHANDPFERALPGFVQEDWRLVRSGRDALKALAGLVRGRRVLLPALCCESMIVPFTLNGCEVVFYRLREDLRGDEADVRDKLADGALLLYMPYFGIRPFSDAFLRELKGCGVLLAEDRTQDIVIPRREEGFTPDATFASLRKWAALPEGGMLRTALPVEIGPADSRFGDLRREAMEKRDRYLKSGDPALKRDALRLLHEAEALLDRDGAPAAISEPYRRTLLRLDLAEIGRVRQRNLGRLAERLEPLRRAGRLRFLSDRAAESGLYLPVLLEDRDTLKLAMWAQGVYHPVIWPEPEAAAGVCPVSRFVVDHMLALICDQRYSLADMDFLADRLIETLG